LKGELAAAPHWASKAGTSVVSGTRLLSDTVVINACH
jgi:hypothetical protein